MAEKLSVIIALEGAQEIKRQLADVGQAGKDCFKEINDAAAEVGGFNKLDTSRLGEGLVAAGVAGKDVAKVLDAVNKAGRMETLVNGIAAVENGFAKAGAAVGEFGKALGFVLPSVKMLARLLVLAFGAAVVGAIVSTTKALLELDAQAIKLGTSIGEVAKAQEVFKQMGADAATAAKGVADFFEKMNLDAVKKAIKEIDEGMATFTGLDALKRAAAGFGEAADLARKKLEEIGKLDTKLSPAARAIDDIKKSTMGASQQMLAMLQVFGTMGNTAERNQLIFANFSKEMATLIIQALNAGVSIQDLKTKLDSIPAPTGHAAEAATRLSLAWETLKTIISAPFSVSPEAMDSIAQLLNKITELANAFSTSQFRADAITQLSQSLQGLSQILQGIIIILELLGQTGFAAMKYIEAGAIEVWQTIIGWINKAIDAVKQFFGAGGGQAAGAGAGGFARGGMIGGRGSGSSDSNLAWVSRGEHIMPARAVAAPGVLAFLEALRRSGGNLRGVLDRMGHFALGGMVRAPAFAGGGMVGGMSNVTIQFPGMNPISGLRASSAVVDELRRSAALAQVRSGGRKPSRYS